MAEPQYGPPGFEQYYRDDLHRVIRHLMRRGASMEAARDATQEAMVGASRKWKSIQHPMAWVRRTAYRSFLRNARKVSIVDLAPAEERDERAEAELDSVAEAQTVDRWLSRLTEEQRDVMACVLDGFRPAAIAGLLRIPQRRVYYLREQARSQLRQLLEAEAPELIPPSARRPSR
jgi:RNA polymerase sigma factor (sigma-70 family)